MSRNALARAGFTALALFLPALCLPMAGCGSSSSNETGATIKTTQTEQDQIDAEMRANDAEQAAKTKKK